MHMGINRLTSKLSVLNFWLSSGTIFPAALMTNKQQLGKSAVI